MKKMPLILRVKYALALLRGDFHLTNSTSVAGAGLKRVEFTTHAYMTRNER